MWAYRIYDENRGVWIEENDDDGESAAGSRMALLVSDFRRKSSAAEHYECKVVVSRWWGGILLGPDRFKHINNATRNVLEKCGFVDADHLHKKKKSSVCWKQKKKSRSGFERNLPGLQTRFE